MVVTTENKKKSKGFLSGLNQLRVGDYKIAVTEIKAALGINWKIHSPLPPSVHFKVIPQIHSKVTP